MRKKPFLLGVYDDPCPTLFVERGPENRNVSMTLLHPAS